MPSVLARDGCYRRTSRGGTSGCSHRQSSHVWSCKLAIMEVPTYGVVFSHGFSRRSSFCQLHWPFLPNHQLARLNNLDKLRDHVEQFSLKRYVDWDEMCQKIFLSHFPMCEASVLVHTLWGCCISHIDVQLDAGNGVLIILFLSVNDKRMNTLLRKYIYTHA